MPKNEPKVTGYVSNLSPLQQSAYNSYLRALINYMGQMQLGTPWQGVGTPYSTVSLPIQQTTQQAGKRVMSNAPSVGYVPSVNSKPKQQQAKITPIQQLLINPTPLMPANLMGYMYRDGLTSPVANYYKQMYGG